MASPQVATIGVPIRFNYQYTDGTPIDISTATTKEIYLQKPNSVVLTRTGVFFTDGTDGKLQYVLATGDDDDAVTSGGNWNAQAFVIVGSLELPSPVGGFQMLPNIF